MLLFLNAYMLLFLELYLFLFITGSAPTGLKIPLHYWMASFILTSLKLVGLSYPFSFITMFIDGYGKCLHIFLLKNETCIKFKTEQN